MEQTGNLILIGMPTSGKSTAGVILAKILGMDFVDTDLLIQKQCGKTLPNILAQDGLDAFLAAEEAACLSIPSSASNLVIATGGSVVYSERAMQYFQTLGKIIYLKIDPKTLQHRLHNAKQRGVVLRDGQTIEDLYEERIPLYERYADLTVAETGLDMEETVQEILKLLDNI